LEEKLPDRQKLLPHCAFSLRTSFKQHKNHSTDYTGYHI